MVRESSIRVRISAQERQFLEDLAATQDISVSEVVRRIITGWRLILQSPLYKIIDINRLLDTVTQERAEAIAKGKEEGN